MKRNISIQLKAALLLVVFGLNTLVGFACAVGVDMGFNATHHYDGEATEVHEHAGGIKHDHHDQATKHEHKEIKTEKKEEKGCCNDSLVKLSQTEKSIPQSNTIISPVFFTVFIASFYDIDILYPSQVAPGVTYFLRSYHPPIADIRIAIQSFQI